LRTRRADARGAKNLTGRTYLVSSITVG